MAPRPAKRQRRATRVLSDDEDEYPAIEPKGTPKAQRQLSLNDNGRNTLSLSPNSTRHATPTKKTRATPQATPEKVRKSTRLESEPDKSTSIQSFFGKATEDQRWQRRNTPDVTVQDEVEAIEDDELSDDALLALDEPVASTASSVGRRSLSNRPITNGKPSSNGSKFLKPSLPFKRPTTPTLPRTPDESQPPWSDRYAPGTLEELAVHKKKVTDVQTWMEGVISGRSRQKLLVLRGPAGSGKTATVNLVAKTLGINTVYWQNPGTSDTITNGSVAAQFDDFLNRGGQFGSLAFDGAQHVSSEGHQAMVIEEFPASLSRSTGPDSVRIAVMRFLTSSGLGSALPFKATVSASCPAVMIISETLLNSSTAFSDSFTAHRILGPEILNHPATTMIDFNAVAQTFVHKALDLAVKKEARDSLRRRIPGPAVMQRLAEMGDLRNAVNSLEFLCVRNDQTSDWSGTVASKSKKAKDATSLTEMERDSLQLVSQRETTLYMFHAAGKVVHNKRDDARILDPRAEPPPKPPDHLMHLYNPKISQVDIEMLFNETGTDIQTFISSLHENYVLSCNGDGFIDHLDECAEALSISDVLNPDCRRSIRSSGGSAATNYNAMQAVSTDALRQDEISFNVAARGLIFHLPYPVKRAAHPSGRAGDNFKMFYPGSLRLWKPTEEIESLISLFAHADSPVNAGALSTTTGVAGWRSDTFGSVQTTATEDEEIPPRRSIPARIDLTLDVLPYLACIKASRKEDTKILKKIVQVQNTNIPLSSDEPDDEEPANESIVSATKIRTGFAATPASRKPPTLKNASTSRGSSRGEDSTNSQMENLYLEEDDIVDD